MHLFVFLPANPASCYAGGYFNLPETKTKHHIILYLIFAFMSATFCVVPVLLTLLFSTCPTTFIPVPPVCPSLSFYAGDKTRRSNHGKRCVTSRSPSHRLSQRKQHPKSSHTHIHTHTKKSESLGTPSIHKKGFFFFHLPIHTLTHTLRPFK